MMQQVERILIFCGSERGILHRDLFRCPGIHESCIEYNEDLITPFEFCRIATNGKSKDWKGSLRVGRRSLRHAMDSKMIEFLNHSKVCTKRCMNRNHLHAKDEFTENYQGRASTSPYAGSLETQVSTEILRMMDSDAVRFWTELQKKNMLDGITKTISEAVKKLGEGDLSSTAPVFSQLTRALHLEETLVKKIQQEKDASDDIELVKGDVFRPGPPPKKPRIWLFHGTDGK